MVKNSSFRAIIALIFLLSSLFSYGQLPAVRLEQIRHCCTGHTGMIEVSLEGDTTGLRYEWSNGARSLMIDNLTEGTYTLSLKGELDCDESETEFEIKKLESPQLQLQQEVVDDCFVDVTARVMQGFTAADMGGFQLTWSDSIKNIQTRRFRKSGVPASVCAEAIAFGGCVFSDNDCETIASAGSCAGITATPRIILNEFNRRDDTTGQYIEILVVGDGVCGSKTDIRNYIVMSSDGWRGSELDSSRIGKNFLRFNDVKLWAEVPHGSLITIYDAGKKHPVLPADDLNDANNDGIYIIPSDNYELLSGNLVTTLRNDTLSFNPEVRLTPTWVPVSLENNAEKGIHIRTPEGVICHGYTATVHSAFQNDTLPYILLNATDSLCGCILDLVDYDQSSSYRCDTVFHTPGTANSAQNELLIKSLRNCSTPLPFVVSPEQVIPEENIRLGELMIYPNPTTGYINIRYHSDNDGRTRVQIIGLLGIVYYDSYYTRNIGRNLIQINMEKRLQPNVYIIAVSGPEENTHYEKIIIADIR